MFFSALARKAFSFNAVVKAETPGQAIHKQSRLHEAPDLQGVTAGGEAAMIFSGSQ